MGSTPSLEVFAPGRVNLIGEHTDYNGGKVLPFAIALGVTLTLRLQDSETGGRSGTALVCQSTHESGEKSLTATELRALVEACGKEPLRSDRVAMPDHAKDTFLTFVGGAIALFLAQGRFHAKAPADALLAGKATLSISIDSNLPIGGGLSSSAALTTGTLCGLSALLAGQLDAHALARTAMYVEHRFAGALTGLMDQLASAYGRVGSYLAIDFADMPRHGRAVIATVHAHEAFAHYTPVAFNTGVAHALAGSEYNKRRQECQEALAICNALTGKDADSLGVYSKSEARAVLLPRTFGKGAERARQDDVRAELADRFASKGVPSDRALLLARRAAHAIMENTRVDDATHALTTGNLAALGNAMRASHTSLRQDYEVSCRELDIAVELVPRVCEELAKKQDAGEHGERGPVVIGARMTGGGFGGSTIQLVRSDLVPALVALFQDKENPFTQATGSKPSLVVSPPSEGIRVRYL